MKHQCAMQIYITATAQTHLLKGESSFLHSTPRCTMGQSGKFWKECPLIVNVTYLESNGFNASMWGHNAFIDVLKFIRYVLINTGIYTRVYLYISYEFQDILIKFEVSLHFLTDLVYCAPRHAA